MRIKQQRAHWVKGYQSAALFDNADHVRKPVVSIFKAPRTAGRMAFGGVRGEGSRTGRGGDNV